MIPFKFGPQLCMPVFLITTIWTKSTMVVGGILHFEPNTDGCLQFYYKEYARWISTCHCCTRHRLYQIPSQHKFSGPGAPSKQALFIHNNHNNDSLTTLSNALFLLHVDDPPSDPPTESCSTAIGLLVTRHLLFPCALLLVSAFSFTQPEQLSTPH